MAGYKHIPACVLLFLISVSKSDGSALKFKASPTINVSVKPNGEYSVGINGHTWLNSAPTFFTVGGTKYSTEDGSLGLVGHTSDGGHDQLGHWQAEMFKWQPKGQKVTLETYIKAYDTDVDAFVFGQRYVDLVQGASNNDRQSVSSGFPAFKMESDPGNNPGNTLGYLAYGGIMTGDTDKKLGRWGDPKAEMHSGLDSGPLALFNTEDDAIFISSFSQFMTGSVVYNNKNMTASWGLIGTMDPIPADFEYSVIMVHSSRGIRQCIEDWGEVMRYYYDRPTHFRESDFANNYLGYWTDNGAYYYYLTEPNKNYQQTIEDVKISAKSISVPYRYVQFDSWWYPKEPGRGGVIEWVGLKDVFPDGMQYLWNQTGWASVAHNRWWSNETVYASKNGGSFNFIVEPETKKAIPQDPEFWDFLMKTSKEWGLLTYEQDWLNTEFDEMDVTVTDVKVGRNWLRQMGEGAAKNGITIQYCMAPSRTILQALEIPVVTQARVSGDYNPGEDNWRIGLSSMLAYAVGIAPFKDNFWTTTYQPGNRYGKNETHPDLHALVATLSTGPVGPSDAIGHSSKTLIMRSCNAEGLLLKPSRPAFSINAQIKQAALKMTPSLGPDGEVWSTYTDISGYIFGIILAADLTGDYNLGPKEAWGIEDAAFKIFPHKPDLPKAADFSEDKKLLLNEQCTKTDFCLYHTVPVIKHMGKDLLLFGELDKWVPMAPQRFKAISESTSDVTIELRGGANEETVIYAAYTDSTEWLSLHCHFDEAGSATISFTKLSCS